MTNLMNKLKIEYPIFQAPMAGVTTSKLVSAVSNAGGLGNIGAGYLSAAETRVFIKEVKQLTKQPFGINLFVPEHHSVSQDEIRQSRQLLAFCLDDLHLNEIDMPSTELSADFDQQLEVVIEQGVRVCSFTFGIPSEKVIKKLQHNGVFVIGTATNVKEAQSIEQAGMDAVVVQGSEAGGHRGTFLDNESYIGLMSLIPQVVDHTSIPVISAGGIMDGRGVRASLCLGAQAAQLGTAFLTTKESGAHPLHKESILGAAEEDVQITRAFSGKSARGINNKFMTTMKIHENDLPAYPYQNSLTKEIRREAAKQQNKDYMSLWSGQSPRLSRDITVHELMDEIVQDYQSMTK